MLTIIAILLVLILLALIIIGYTSYWHRQQIWIETGKILTIVEHVHKQHLHVNER
jgi:hypothetical protein